MVRARDWGFACALLLLLASSAGGCRAAPQRSGPRSLAPTSMVVSRGGGQLDVRYRYEDVGGEVVISIEMAGSGNEAIGDVSVTIAVEGFAVVEGLLTSTARVEPGTSIVHRVRLRPTGDPRPTVSIVTKRGDMEVAHVKQRFMLRDGEMRPCRSADDCPSTAVLLQRIVL